MLPCGGAKVKLFPDTSSITPNMIEEKKYPYQDALRIALEIKAQLEPHCDRIEIAGSIRREKPEVKDIELVAIPKPYDHGIFATGIAAVANHWQKVKGELIYEKCKYTQRVLPGGIKLDLFFAVRDNWGLIYAIRTGSADYSHKVLANRWVAAGFNSVDGFLWKRGEKYEVREEEDLFKMIGLQYVLPKHRI